MIHKQAAINTAKALAFAALATFAVYSALFILPIEITMAIIGIVTFSMLINVMYKMEKGRLETLDRLKKL